LTYFKQLEFPFYSGICSHEGLAERGLQISTGLLFVLKW